MGDLLGALRRPPALVLTLLTFVVLLLTFDVVVEASSNLFKVGVVDWQSLDGVEPLDDDFSRAMTINFLLAAQHFNERRSDVLEVLGESWIATSCPTMNISIAHYCDSQAMLRKTMFNTAELLPDVHAIAGYATAAEGRHAAIAADVVGNVPVVSHWCTTPQTENRDVFPMFARTVVADSDIAQKIAAFLLQMNYTRITGLFMKEDSSPELANEIKQRLLEGGCLAEFFEFVGEDAESIESAVINVAATDLNVVLIVSYNYVIIDNLANIAVKHGLDAANKQIVFTNMDFELGFDDINGNENLTKFVSGAFRVSTLIDKENERVQNYLNLWQSPTDFAPRYTSFINDVLPPNGAGNDSFSCLNEQFNMTIDESFFASNVDKYTEMWGIAYDSMLAIALGACKSNGVNRGMDLMADILSLNYTGLSGRIQFDPLTGNRRKDSFRFQVQNFQPVDAAYEAKRVALYDEATGVFVFENASSLYFRSGSGLESLPAQYDPPVTDKQYLASFLKAFGIGGFMFVALMTIVCSIWLLRNRTATIVVNSQGPLMHLISFGCFIASWAILMISLDDNPNQLIQVNMDSVCMSIPVLFSLGFQIALLGLCGKTYRIYSIWNNKRIMTKRFSIQRVVVAVIAMVLIELIVLICWITIAPLKWKRQVLSTDRFGQPLQEIGLCDAESWVSGSFAVVVFALHGVLLCIMGALAYQVSDMPGEFGEAHWLGIACIILTQIYLIALPAIAAVYSVNVSGRFLLAMGLVFISAAALLFVMFAPKMYFLSTGRELFKKGSTDSRLRLDDGGGSKSSKGKSGVDVVNPAFQGPVKQRPSTVNTAVDTIDSPQTVFRSLDSPANSKRVADSPGSMRRNLEAAKNRVSTGQL